jgi:hypothetical protein
LKLNFLFFAMIIFLLFLIASCSSEVGKNSAGNEHEEFPPSMNGSILIDGKEYQMAKGGYRWERKQGLKTQVVTTDHASPYQMAEHIKAISLTPNEKIKISIEENPEISVYLVNVNGREKEIKLVEHLITAPSEKGMYIYEVEAKWKNGTVSYVFVIEI